MSIAFRTDILIQHISASLDFQAQDTFVDAEFLTCNRHDRRILGSIGIRYRPGRILRSDAREQRHVDIFGTHANARIQMEFGDDRITGDETRLLAVDSGMVQNRASRMIAIRRSSDMAAGQLHVCLRSIGQGFQLDSGNAIDMYRGKQCDAAQTVSDQIGNRCDEFIDLHLQSCHFLGGGTCTAGKFFLELFNLSFGCLYSFSFGISCCFLRCCGCLVGSGFRFGSCIAGSLSGSFSCFRLLISLISLCLCGVQSSLCGLQRGFHLIQLTVQTFQIVNLSL